MAIIKTAILLSVVTVAFGVAASAGIYYKQADEIATATVAMTADRNQLALDRGLLLQETAIRREIHTLDSSKGQQAKRVLIDRARAIKSITVRDFTLDQSGSKFTMKIAGKYGDIVAASVSIPANDPGVAIDSIRIDADSSAGHDAAIETLTGQFTQI